MLKNVVLDIGGVILNFNNENLKKYLNKTEKQIKKLDKILLYEKRIKYIR